ncbi:MAG: hypothetical protein MHM6MM_004234 [Cercozoa sp. M6MM]
MTHPQDYGGYTRAEWLWLHWISLAVIAASVAGACYIILRVLRAKKRAKEAKRPLPFVAELPMYMSIADLLFAITHGSDRLASLSQGHVTQGGACVIMGAATNFAILCSPFWATGIAYYIWSLVVREKKIELGRGNWRMHAWGFGIPAFLGLMQILLKHAGPEATFCSCKGYTNTFLYQTVQLEVAILALTLLYSSTRRRINEYLRSLNGNDRFVSYNRMNDRKIQRLRIFARQMPFFVLVFVVQFTPMVVYAISGSPKPNFWLLLATSVIVNTGGVADALVYKSWSRRSTRFATLRGYPLCKIVGYLCTSARTQVKTPARKAQRPSTVVVSKTNGTCDLLVVQPAMTVSMASLPSSLSSVHVQVEPEGDLPSAGCRAFDQPSDNSTRLTAHVQ